MAAELPVAYRAVVHELLADRDVSEAKMMGMPCVKLGRTMFAGCFDADLVVKLGRDRVDALVAAGRAVLFDPSGRGRPMRDWAQVPEPADDWLALADEARMAARSAA